MKYFLLIAALFAAQVHAYSNQELRTDCQAAEAGFSQEASPDANQSIKSARCIGYLSGFADSYAVSDYLAEKIGVKLNAFCLPHDKNLAARLVRAVLNHLNSQPPNSTSSTAITVAGALAKTFPCTDSLESKK